MSDESAIRDVIARCQDAWNRGDAAAFGTQFSPDIDFVDVLGRLHSDLQEINAGHDHIFRTIYKNSRVAYTVDRVRFLRPDVAVALVSARLECYLAGTVDDPHRASHAASPTLREEHARLTFTLARQTDAWKIVVFQNTRVAGK